MIISRIWSEYSIIEKHFYAFYCLMEFIFWGIIFFITFLDKVNLKDNKIFHCIFLNLGLGIIILESFFNPFGKPFVIGIVLNGIILFFWDIWFLRYYMDSSIGYRRFIVLIFLFVGVFF